MSTAARKALRRPVTAVPKVVVCRTELQQPAVAALRKQLRELADKLSESPKPPTRHGRTQRCALAG